jgi:hypothetical protein
MHVNGHIGQNMYWKTPKKEATFYKISEFYK